MSPERPRVLGPVVDAETRCIHYSTPLDVIAIKFRCCGAFYPCHLCHAESVDHPAAPAATVAMRQRAEVVHRDSVEPCNPE